MYSLLIYFVRRRTPVYLELFLAHNSFLSLLQVPLDGGPIFFDWEELWRVGRVLVIGHHMNVVGSISLHDLFSVITIVSLQERQ